MAQNLLHLGIALDGYGWHPRAWQQTLAADPAISPVTSGRYWAELARTAERGLLDFLTIDDSFIAAPGRREGTVPHRLAGRADAVLVAARIAPVTHHIGLIPVATVTHTEPFHVSKAIATLDFVSRGRAGWQVRVSPSEDEAAAFGRRSVPDGNELFDEATDFVDVVRRLWDSWEDDAVIRDVSTGRYVDRDKLHYIDFVGKYFSVKGPSITPRPPQGQTVVGALAHAKRVYEFADASADLVFITPTDEESVREIVNQVSIAKPIADLVVSFGGGDDFGSDALIFTGSPAQLVELLVGWHDLGVPGFRLRPAVNATDLPIIVDEVVPLLQRTGRFRTGYRDDETLRERFGLPAAVNRYATAGVS
ncbi:LLM class flavin-dependent oxidoreductase [Mycolicibacterium sp. ELW1]|uniref:LLM class flavin-dependent oxidoreductase n=1 Tax=Mycobacteriaceae TaxID=1762 RepID=UPI0011EE475F|nr:LLM class flavin-dependent oxidoreductase [Mycobacterium sp. ELW1]QEN12352.1 LLM class flavin-dependent oxidoreductase [Mycobacterium sp. ELW1]